MDNKSIKSRFGITFGKGAVVTILLFVLVIVVVSQIPSKTIVPRPSNDSVENIAPSTLPRKSTVATSNPPAIQVVRRSVFANKSESNIKLKQTPSSNTGLDPWPVVRAEHVSRHDPFVLPDSLRPLKVVTLSKKELANQRHEQAMKIAAEKTVELERLRLAELESQRLDKIENDRLQLVAIALAEKKRVEDRISQLQSQGVSMFFSTGDDRMVQIGNLRLSEGSEFDGIRVEKIRKDGTVVLSPSRSIPNLPPAGLETR